MDESAARKVADQLRVRILAGEFGTAGRLPSLAAVVDQHGHSDTTARAAYRLLIAEGLVESRERSGYFVRPRPTAKRVRRIPAGSGEGGSTFASEMRRLGLVPRTELVRRAVEPVPPALAERMGLEPGAEVLVRVRHMFASGSPVQLATSYIPMSVAGDVSIAEPDTGPTGMYRRLAARGFRPDRFTEEIETRLPEPEEAAFLALLPSLHALVITRTTWGAADRVLEVAVNVLAGQHWKLIYEWSYAD